MKNRKTALSVFLIALLGFGSVTPATAEAASRSLSASSVIVVDAKSRKVLYSKSAHTKRAPASTAKLLSVMVILDHLKPGQIIRVPSYATRVQPTKIHIRAGERFYVRDLIKAMLLRSANDAAYALAIATAGSVSGFAKMMNAKARSIGVRHSNFKSPAGLPVKGQYSTAYDLVKIMMAAERYSIIVKTMKMKYAVIRSRGGRKFSLKSTNKMLWRSSRSEVIGKTGYTRRAKHCFAGRIRVSGKKKFIAVMGAPRRVHLWSDLKKLAAFPSSSFKKTSQDPISINRGLHSRSKIKQIQNALKNAGYFKGPVKGDFGPLTLAATKRFQKANGLVPDGIVQTKTWAKLKKYTKVKRSPIQINRKLHTRKEIEKIQSALKSAGYLRGPVDGQFGPITLDATKRFQRAQGLVPDGIVYTKTWGKLKSHL